MFLIVFQIFCSPYRICLISPTGWTATESDPATTGLKVSVAQEPANKTASQFPLPAEQMRMMGSYHSPGKPLVDPAPHFMGEPKVVQIGLRLGVGCSVDFCWTPKHHPNECVTEEEEMRAAFHILKTSKVLGLKILITLLA